MVSALLIALREGLEAALIVGIVIGYLGKTNTRESKWYAWAGVIVAIALSAVLGIGMRLVGADLQTPYEQIFEGTTILLAVAVLTWMIFWMRYQARFLKSNLERQIHSAVTEGQHWGIFALTFLAVFREGIETALFLAANAFAADAAATLTGALTGLAIAAALGALVYFYAIHLNLSLFFDITSVLLVVFAAGMIAHGIGEFQEIGAIPFLSAAAWDTKNWLDNESVLGSLLGSLVGYNDQPSILQVATYILYWVVVLQGIRWWTQRLGTRPVSKHV